MTLEDPRTNPFLADFARLSEFGATPNGGVDRQAGTEADADQRSWFCGWLSEHGFEVRVDPIGNVFGLRTFVPGAPYVLAGSHLDSQPLGGKFDGAYGVLAAAHAADAVAGRVAGGELQPRLNVAVVDWFNEEGSRFQPSMMGSAVLTGKLPLEKAYAALDREGIDVRTALEGMGVLGEAAPLDIASYAEIHVEQGRVLEDEGTTIGLVEATWAARKYRVRVLGEQSHTGSTPMRERRDALLGASMLVLAARRIADEHAGVPVHTSVSALDVEPNSPVVVAREARLLVDLRAPDERALDLAAADFEKALEAVRRDAGVEVESALEHRWGVLPYQSAGVALAADEARRLGLSHRPMMTLAGHDSTNMKDVVPTVMLFVPSVDGIAHNEGELTRDEDLLAGLDLLTNVVARLATGELAREDALASSAFAGSDR